MSEAEGVHHKRIGRLRALLQRDDLGALLVTGAANVRYLTGYVGSNGTAVIGHDGARLLTDSRYAVSAREQVSAAEVVIGSRDLLGDVAGAVRELTAGAPVGLEAANISLAQAERFRARLDGLAVESTAGLVEGLRIIKDPQEVQTMRRAATVADRALAAVIARGVVGRTEREVAFDLHGALLDEGAEDLSFATIVAAGPRGARPHAVPTIVRSSRTPWW